MSPKSQYQTYCRLCAELKSAQKLFDLNADTEKFKDVLEKLSFLNTMIDLTDETVPKTVCFVCYESLEKAFDFLCKVQKAQDILKELLLNTVKSDSSGDERDSRCSPELDVPTEEEEEANKFLSDKNCEQEKEVPDLLEIKNEPKEEVLSNSFSDCNENTNVEEILDATILDNATEVTWYDKEIDKQFWNDYTWLCSHCKMEFADLYVLRTHTKEAHKKCFAFTCMDCFVKPNDFEEFIDHVRRHRKYLRYCCPYCNTITDSRRSMSQHLSEHFQSTEHACKLCGEILKDAEALEKHTLQYSTIKTQKKPRRKRGAPITTEDLTCKLCNKVYKNLNSLRDHSKLHTSERQRNYTCDRCGKAFFQKGTLMSHIMVHDKVKPHICKICNKSFLFPNMLRRHVEMHTGVKPFSCEQCGRSFRLLYQLKAHKIIHTDKMPYSCQYCNKSFRFKQIMKNHELQHTGAKPYMCKVCSMEFTNWSNYNKHMKRRHSIDTSKKKITPEGVIPINPETGQLLVIRDSEETAVWKSKIMIPCKRGKKKVVKGENVKS